MGRRAAILAERLRQSDADDNKFGGIGFAGEATGIQVVIVDDQPLLAEGFERIVDAQPGMAVVSVAHDGASGVRACQELKPDIVLMSIGMPVMDGVAATRETRRLLPGPRVLILTITTDDITSSGG